MEYRASAAIEATPEQVWVVLTDTGKWHEWDSYTVGVDGEPREGDRVTVHTRLSPRAFPVVVSEMESPRLMVWTGRMPFGLFQGVRTFRLARKGEGTEFLMHEVFSGPLLGVMKRKMPDMTEAFNSFAEGLKQRCEAGRTIPEPPEPEMVI